MFLLHESSGLREGLFRHGLRKLERKKRCARQSPFRP